MSESLSLNTYYCTSCKERQAEIERLREAIGLMTTAKPSMVMRADDPIGMAQEVVAEVERLREVAKLWDDATCLGHKHLSQFCQVGESVINHGIPRAAKEVERLRALCAEAALRNKQLARLVEITRIDKEKSGMDSAKERLWLHELYEELERLAAVGRGKEKPKDSNRRKENGNDR